MTAAFTLDLQNPRFQEVKRRFLDTLGAELQAGPRSVVIQEPKRSLEQNALLWAVLHDLTEQVGWRKERIRGNELLRAGAYVAFADEPAARKLSPEIFKDLLTAALKSPQMYRGIDGGLVAIGLSTSRMSKRQMSELIELAFAFGADKGVVFTEPRNPTPET